MSIYIGDGTAKNVAKIYVGINGVARKVVKGYVGVNGVARKFYNTGGVNPYPQLINYLMLYDYGDECVDVTGGWENTKTIRGGTWTKHDNDIYVYVKGSSWFIAMGIHNAIDVTDYVLACINWDFVKDSTKWCMNRFACGSIRESYMEIIGNDGCLALYTNVEALPNSYNGITTFDISNISQSVYFQQSVQTNNSRYSAYNYMYHCFLVKADDWSTLATKAGITASSIDDILANSATLLSNEDAVNFMVRQCTGNFMVSAISNATFLTALAQSAYQSTVYDNEHWNKFLSM